MISNCIISNVISLPSSLLSLLANFKSLGINSFQKDLFEIIVFPLDPFVRVSIKCCAFHLHNAAYRNTEHLANVCVDFL